MRARRPSCPRHPSCPRRSSCLRHPSYPRRPSCPRRRCLVPLSPGKSSIQFCCRDLPSSITLSNKD
ncbi:MAG: hypothetical protein EON49_09525 [Acidovorax sp.]|nr:MAG: hypothetical protein EON49_09525 [Acidovorax sp.]